MIENGSPRSDKYSKSDKMLRIRYYQSIKDKGDFKDTFIKPPAHWLNPNVFSIKPILDQNSGVKQNKSWITILSLWNSMIGSSIVSLPYLSLQAGIIPTIFLNIIYCFICYYTSQVIIKTGGKDNDFSDTIHRYFGEKYGVFGRIIQIIFNLLINVGGIFIFFLIINQNLYPILASLLKLFGMEIDVNDLAPSFERPSIIYCGIFISIILLPLLVKKQINILIKINSFGIYFVSVLIVFVIYTGISSIISTKFDLEYIVNKDSSLSEIRHLYLFGERPSMLAGSLTLGYFCHSFVLSVVKINEKQEHNKRDLFYGYFLVWITYTLIGLLGYIGFTGTQFMPDFKDVTLFFIFQNWFLFFDPQNIFILFLRLLSVFQLCTILPILFYIVRTQFFGTFYKDNYPSKLHVTVFSSSVLILSLLVLYLCYNLLGELMSFVGAATGLVLIYITPLIVNMIYYREKHPNETERKLLLNEVNSSDNENTTNTQEFSSVFNGPRKISQKPPNKIKDACFYISQSILILFGIFTLVVQFVTVNIFNVHLNE